MLKDSVIRFHTVEDDGAFYAFVASLDTSGDVPRITYDVTLNNEPVRMLSELPPAVHAEYGLFISRVQQWENGGKLHESLRHDD